MPRSAPRLCGVPGCGHYATHHGYCINHERTHARKPWAKRDDAPKRLSGRHGVNRRVRWLTEHPLCLHCEREGRVGAGVIVDHVIPLSKGGADDDTNLQSLCREHDRIKTAIDLGRAR